MDQPSRFAALLTLWSRAVRHLTGYSGPLYNEMQASEARREAGEKVAPAARRVERK